MFFLLLEVVLLNDELCDVVVMYFFFKVFKVVVIKFVFLIIYNDKFIILKSNGKWKKRDVSIYIERKCFFWNKSSKFYVCCVLNEKLDFVYFDILW